MSALSCFSALLAILCRMQETCAVVLEAGLDIDCGNFLLDNLNASIAAGATPVSAVDTALTHMFLVQVLTHLQFSSFTC